MIVNGRGYDASFCGYRHRIDKASRRNLLSRAVFKFLAEPGFRGSCACRPLALPPPHVIHIDNAVPRRVNVDHERLTPSLWACTYRLADVFRWPQRAVPLEYLDRLPGAKGTIVGGARLKSQSASWRCCARKLHPHRVNRSSPVDAVLALLYRSRIAPMPWAKSVCNHVRR
jgi:hypothetical protein